MVNIIIYLLQSIEQISKILISIKQFIESDNGQFLTELFQHKHGTIFLTIRLRISIRQNINDPLRDRVDSISGIFTASLSENPETLRSFLY